MKTFYAIQVSLLNSRKLFSFDFAEIIFTFHFQMVCKQTYQFLETATINSFTERFLSLESLLTLTM